MRLKHPVLPAVVMALAIVTPLAGALAAGSSSSSSSQDVAARLDKAENMIETGNARDAIPILEKVLQSDRDNADAYNYLGLAYRDLGQYDRSERHYKEALALDSEHKGAREYLGQLYLKLDKPVEAERQLARLDEICTYGCEEYDMLKRAIEEYRQSH